MSAFECHPQRALSISARVITDDRRGKKKRRGTLFHLFELSTPLIIKVSFFFSLLLKMHRGRKRLEVLLPFANLPPPPLLSPYRFSFNLWPRWQGTARHLSFPLYLPPSSEPALDNKDMQMRSRRRALDQRQSRDRLSQ